MAGDSWQQIWDERKAALESVLGKSDDMVLTAFLPFHLGGQADVLLFHKHIAGRVAATCVLLGEPSQKKNELGVFELMVAHRDENDWGPQVISKLARYTCDACLKPGDTMEIGPAVPTGSTIAGFLFLDYSRFKFQGIDAGLLLCIGITADELAVCKQGKPQEVLDALKTAQVYPYTDLFRASALISPKRGLWSRLTGGGA